MLVIGGTINMTMRYGCDIIDKEEKIIKENTESIHLTSYIAHKSGKQCTKAECKCNCDKTE
jgi:hypothetical protein